MGKQRTAEPVPIVTGMSSDDLLSARKATALIASRDPEVNEHQRLAYGRARSRLAYWVLKGALAKTKSRHFRFGDLGRVMRATWPGRFDNVLSSVDGGPLGGSVREDEEILDRTDADLLPGELARCHDEILKLSARVATLKSDLATERQRIRDLQ